MTTSSSFLTRLQDTHPHSTALLHVFAPLLQAQKALAQTKDAEDMVLPAFDALSFTGGKSWMQASELPCTDAFLKKAVTRLANESAKVLPQQKEAFDALKSHLHKNLLDARLLAQYRMQGALPKAKSWAKKQQLPQEPAAMLAMLLGGAVAQQVRHAASKQDLASWNKGYCPICGSLPHGSLLKDTEGARFLQCSLCAHEWRYARTACPICKQQDSTHLDIFFTEDHPEERAEACALCKHYLLALDTRKLADSDPPLELYLLCMAPLDILMQEKGYISASAATIKPPDTEKKRHTVS